MMNLLILNHFCATSARQSSTIAVLLVPLRNKLFIFNIKFYEIYSSAY